MCHCARWLRSDPERCSRSWLDPIWWLIAAIILAMIAALLLSTYLLSSVRSAKVERVKGFMKAACFPPAETFTVQTLHKSVLSLD